MSAPTAAVLVTLGLAGAAVAAPVAGADAPLVIVNSLYVLKAAPSHVERLFAADLAAAYRKDTGRRGEVGAIDFDWRYDAQDVKITDLKVFWAPPPADTQTPTAPWPTPQAHALAPALPPVETPPPKAVEAAFRNFGRPHAVFYNFCRTPRGELRIADVYTTGRDGWSLRRMLKLDPRRVRC